MTEEQLLLETLEYYTEDVDRRCVNEDGKCSYDPKKLGKEAISEGCAIGRYMTESQKAEAGDTNWAIEDLPEQYLPDALMNIANTFLMRIQTLHDSTRFWDSKGLSCRGKEEVERIVKAYSFDVTKFEKYLEV